MRMRNRKHCKIDKLPSDQKDAVDQMLLGDYTYTEIVDYLAANGVPLSQSSICRYARGYLGDLQKLNMVQENMRGMMEEINRYPDLDTTEAIVRLTSHNLLRTINDLPSERWQEVDVKDLLHQANGLIRAAAYKTNVDMKTRTDYEKGMLAVKEYMYDTLAKENPKLYGQLAAFLNEKIAEGKP